MLPVYVSAELGDRHSMIMVEGGAVWSTALESAPRGDVPSRGVGRRFHPSFPSDAKGMAAGIDFSLVVKEDGSVWVMGDNDVGQLGDESRYNRAKFFYLRELDHVTAVAVAAGGFHSMLLTKNGYLFASGWNKYGQLGDGSILSNDGFRPIADEVVAIAAGTMHSLILRIDGSVWSAGWNDSGQLGDGSKELKRSYHSVISSGAECIAAGNYHSMTLKQDGSVWVTGWNKFGQLGDGSTKDKTEYAQVVSSGAKAIAGGCRHSMMLKKDGSVWTTGYNAYGQLGDGSADDRLVFVQVIPDGVKFIAAGAYHSMAIKEDGSIWGAGSNEYGQFGDGTTTSQSRFVRLAPLGDGARSNRLIYTWIHLFDLQFHKYCAMFRAFLLWPCLSVLTNIKCAYLLVLKSNAPISLVWNGDVKCEGIK